MIPTFYSRNVLVCLLEIEAKEWHGTPFMENSAVKGAGVSCHFLVGSIYKETGFLPMDFEIPKGSARRLRHGAPMAMVEFIDTAMGTRFAKVESDPQPGDMIVIAEGGRAKHVGLVLSGKRFVHVLHHSGVTISHLDDATYREVVAIRRPQP